MHYYYYYYYMVLRDALPSLHGPTIAFFFTVPLSQMSLPFDSLAKYFCDYSEDVHLP